MNRFELERHLGQFVEITLFDGDVIKGELHKTGEEAFKNNPNLYLPSNWYFLVTKRNNVEHYSCLFRCIHVVNLKEIDLCQKDKADKGGLSEDTCEEKLL